jgi:hypothetical protein
MHRLAVEETMPVNSDVLKQDLRKSINDLKKLGSEIRGDLRAAGADARKQWKHFLEPQLANVERLAKDVQAASHDAVARTSAALSAFRSSLKTAKKNAPRGRAKRSH